MSKEDIVSGKTCFCRNVVATTFTKQYPGRNPVSAWLDNYIGRWENIFELPLLIDSLCFWYLGSSSTLQFRAERIKIPPTRYPRSTGSDRGTVEFGSYIVW